MIVMFPLLAIAATVIALRSAERGSSSAGTHWRWFAAWSAAGAAMTFSFLTGLSIGLFVLPLAGVLLFWVARRAPHLPDALGFVEGIAVLLLLVAFLNRAGSGIDPAPWLEAGLSLGGFTLAAYVVLRRRTARAGTEAQRLPPV